MLKLNKILFRKFISLFIILFFILGGIFYFGVKEVYLNQTKDALLNNLEIISFDLEKKNFDSLAYSIKEKLHLRLTVISKDGEVLAESHKDKRSMDNHKNRIEVQEASYAPYGYSIRYSKTLQKELLYIVKRYSYKNSFIYLRLAKDVANIYDAIFLLGAKILFILALFFIVMFLVSYKIGQDIEAEIKNIIYFLTSLTKKSKITYISSNYSLEFAQITKLLTKISQILSKKEIQKEKYTEKLKLNNQQKDDIISAISHEFKNPIAVINGYSQTLVEDENINKRIRKKFLQKIYNNGVKLSELIDTLRLSIKLDSSQYAIKSQKVNLKKFVEENIDALRINFPNRVIEVIAKEDVFVEVDKTLFGIVVSNLVENALKYSQEDVVVEISSKALIVKDEGIGIAQEDIQKITSKFYRVTNNSWNNSLGLGLFLVQTIVELHNFKLNIESKKNIGSTFSITF